MNIDFKLSKKQKQFIDTDADEILFGGAAGGGKSFIQLIDSFLYAMQYKGSKQIILRTTFPELDRSIIRTALDMYPTEFFKYNSSKHTMSFKNGSILDFGYADGASSVTQYKSQEFDCIRFDEASDFDPYVLEYMKSRLRGANNFPKKVCFTSNPGGPAMNYLREKFVDPAPYGEPFIATEESGNTVKRLFIQSKVYDNIFLLEKDPGYVARLENLPEADRRALLEGDWYFYSGLYFSEFKRDIHVIKPFEIDKEWKRYVSIDYGLDMLAAYWIAIDNQDRSYVYRELHESDLIISEAAGRIKACTEDDEDIYQYLAPGDLWNRRQETGKSVVDIFRDNGIRLNKASNKRIPGWLAVKEFLKPCKDEFGDVSAKMKIFDICANLIKSISSIQGDPKNPNDVAVKPHNITHAADSIRYFCAARTQPAEEEEEPSRAEKALLDEMVAFTSSEIFDVYGGGF